MHLAYVIRVLTGQHSILGQRPAVTYRAEYENALMWFFPLLVLAYLSVPPSTIASHHTTVTSYRGGDSRMKMPTQWPMVVAWLAAGPALVTLWIIDPFGVMEFYWR